jgi:hypothetical protein
MMQRVFFDPAELPQLLLLVAFFATLLRIFFPGGKR